MKRTINGRRYDTAKAKLIAEASSTVPQVDFHYWREALYRTPRGRWFLHGEGGALSRWALRTSDGSTYGERIVALSANSALQWLEERNEFDAINRYFADQVEDA